MDEIKKFPKQLMGVVIGVIDDKTVKVRVETKFQHPLYRKIIKVHKNYLVDNTDKIKVEVGKRILIQERSPISKRKTFFIKEVK